ncbi:MAG: tetratricopeptide repeat protein [Candidatus Omnitrophica bacterium]|nr:tetratricopeptide repeat protein [Candidatus Omnitrophota bacterium]MBU1932700.1 tetratricopeptide repeat protein [Candidatus Omnitrophota bacterium]
MKRAKLIHILILALMTVAVFAPSLSNNFTWDDKFLVVDNLYIKSWSYLPEIFTKQLYQGSYTHSGFYRPLELVSFALDYAVWGLNPFGYHLTSLLFHVSNAILVYLILIALGSLCGLAFLAAALFAVSPPISGITYYISARSDLLMAFFLFLSFLLFIQYRREKNAVIYILSILAFTFSFLSKEMGLMLVLFLALEIFRSGKNSRKDFICITPYVVILVIYVIARITALNFNKGEGLLLDDTITASVPLWRRVLTDVKIVPKYLGLLLFPYGLHMEWFVEPVRCLMQLDVIVSLAVCGLVVLLIKKLRKLGSHLAVFGSMWFLAGLLPVLNIYPISVFFGEGWLYVPSVGFYMVLAALFETIIFPKAGRKFGGVLAGCAVIYYSLFTLSYGKVWESGISLFSNVLKYEQKSPLIHSTYNNLGVAYYDDGEPDQAIRCYKKSIELNPEYENSWNNLGVVYAELKKPVKAIRYFKKAITIRRDYLDAYSNLSHAYKSLGLTDRAIDVAMAAIKIDPCFYGAYINLGYIYVDRGEEGTAEEFFKKAARLRKAEFEPHYCLGTLYFKKGVFDAALVEYEKAHMLGLGDHKFYNELAFLYLKNRKFRESEQALLKSILLNPRQSEPHNNLGNLYSIFGYFKLAIDEYEKALAIDPEDQKIKDNLIKTRSNLEESPGEG